MTFHTEGSAGHSPHRVIEAFSEIAKRVHSSEDYEETMFRITETAVSAIGGCAAASLSMIEKAGPPVTHAATDRLARDGDDIQYAEGEGPCLDAAMKQRWVYTPRMADDPRWPRSSARLAGELGVASMFSCRLALDAAPNQTLGGLNLYSRSVDGFADEDQMMAILLSSLGAVVVDASRQQLNLRAAIESRQAIGEAIGILRAQGDMDSDEAFRMLSQASQRMNIKLHQLARRISERSRSGHLIPRALPSQAEGEAPLPD